MAFNITYSIDTEEIEIDEKTTETIEVLNIEIQTDYPREQIKVCLGGKSRFGTQTDRNGICKCSTSSIHDYHVVVGIHDEVFEGDIEIENEEDD